MKSHKELLNKPYAADVIERFIRYAKVETTSDRHAEGIPSTAGQWDLAKMLEAELKGLGITDVYIDEHCFVIAKIPASPGAEKKPAIGLMAHLDTSNEVSGANVKPRLVENYDGQPIELSPGWTLDPDEFKELADYKGDSLIVTDGTTLLGADDKAGIAIIMSAVKTALADKSISRPPLVIVFSPDEEIGRGMNAFPLAKLKMDACYTYDGGRRGEIESECFNAYEARLVFTGKSSHPGYARGVMVNAASMAAAFASMLPRAESPEATDGWYGYYHILEIHGAVEKANVDLILRDYAEDGIARRIEAVKQMASAVETMFPGGSIKLEFNKQYCNMKKKLSENPIVLELLYEAANRAGAEPYSKPIRGGTDGARLTEMGVATPNMFTGMHNFHSRYEWASVSEMVLAIDTTLELMRLWAERA